MASLTGAGDPKDPSVAHRVAQIVAAVFFCLCCSGLIFGFAALKPVLIQEGVYGELCSERHRDESGNWVVCQAQDLRLDLLFTIASVATSVAGFPTGFTLDALGPRTTSIIGAALMILGNIFFSSGYQSSYVDFYLLGYLTIALGGPLICLSSFHLSNAFGGAHAGLILSAITGSFDASSIPFVIYQFVYRQTGGKPAVQTFFLLYLIIPILLVVEQLVLAPKETYQRIAPTSLPSSGDPSESSPLLPSVDSEANVAAALIASGFSHIHLHDDVGDDEGMRKVFVGKDALTGTLYGMTAWEQVRTKWFWLLTGFVAVHMTRVNFYILSVDSQLESFTGSRTRAELLTRLFTILLPVGGILGIPVVGLLIDRRPFLDVIAVAMIFGVGFGTLGLASSEGSQILGMAFFVLFRPLLYTAVSEAVAKIMGFASFGTIYGLAMTLSGVVALVNAPLDVLVKGKLQGDYVPLNAAFIFAGVLSSGAFLVAIWRQTRTA